MLLFVCLFSALHFQAVSAHFSQAFLFCSLQYLLQGSLFCLITMNCWFHAGWHWRGSPEHHGIRTPIPAKSPSPFLSWGPHVSFAFLLSAAEAKRDEKCQGKQFSSPLQNECCRVYRLSLECVLRTGLLEYICPGGRFSIHMAQYSKSCFTLLWWFTVDWEHLPLLGLGRAEQLRNCW